MAEAELVVEVENLTRRFPRCEALAGVSFSVHRGEIIGLLGPNGSGKTTLLRILSSFLAPTAGRVRVAGCDSVLQSLDLRRRIGYLPEGLPLYPEMRIAEYLLFRGRLHGLRGPRLDARLRDVLELCDLGGSSRRIIGNLSRGFRQRTGLADCLLHEPDVLLLDEPLAGLDLAQVQMFRALLSRIAGEGRTILFSTHVLPEAEHLCHRVLILAEGRLAAADAPARLAEAHGADAFDEAYLALTSRPSLVPPSRKRSAS